MLSNPWRFAIAAFGNRDWYPWTEHQEHFATCIVRTDYLISNAPKGFSQCIYTRVQASTLSLSSRQSVVHSQRLFRKAGLVHISFAQPAALAIKTSRLQDATRLPYTV